MYDPSIKIVSYRLRRQLAQAREKKEALIRNFGNVNLYLNTNLKDLDDLIKQIEIQLEALKEV